MSSTTEASALCDCCGSDRLEAIYRPEDSERGLTVHLCRHCGLVQSLPRVDRVPRRETRVSSGADWGNVRYGKGFRAAAAIDRLARRLADIARPAILDVGASRGAFIEALRTLGLDARVTAVEPDMRVLGDYARDETIETICERIEDVDLPSEAFDLVHSCHTLEHLRSPAATLRDHWRVLKPGGLLYVDVPNLAFLASPNVVEEWFIDKHLYHFSNDTLGALLRATGFRAVSLPDPRDTENIALLAVKATKEEAADANDPVARSALRLVARYKERLGANREALKTVAHRLEAMAGDGLVIWGAGRLFDALVRYGGFDASRCAALVDRHLPAYVGERHGVAVLHPRDLPRLGARTVVAMSRTFAGEIEREAKELVPDIKVVSFAWLMAEQAAAPLAAAQGGR
ncbi:MAG: class I SAM-dependent methyltransferase [Alphaproteobacteria bacterium]|nr:class I SAM-dependent methyltransferase [Alphaproteobacteria bacterium]